VWLLVVVNGFVVGGKILRRRTNIYKFIERTKRRAE
jgi:hypothetical protein